MRAIDEYTITEAALDQMASTPNPRLKEIMAALTRHLHEFAREVDLTPEEWLDAIKFLTAVGQKCTAYRQEFILLSDTLGLSSLVNALHDRRATEAGTKSSLVGPFYRQDSPNLKLGDTIVTKPTNGQEVCLYGRVTNSAGEGVPNATVQVWQPDETGNYDLQKHDPSEMDLRGTFRTRCRRPFLPAHHRAVGLHDPDGWPGGRHDPRAKAPRLPARAYSLHHRCGRVSRSGHGAVFAGRRTHRFGHRVRRHGILGHRRQRQ